MSLFFFFNDTATTEIYTLSLHDALPISTAKCSHGAGRVWSPRSWTRPTSRGGVAARGARSRSCAGRSAWSAHDLDLRSEEHTSELQSQSNLVCRLLLEKKKKKK